MAASFPADFGTDAIEGGSARRRRRRRRWRRFLPRMPIFLLALLLGGGGVRGAAALAADADRAHRAGFPGSSAFSSLLSAQSAVATNLTVEPAGAYIPQGEPSYYYGEPTVVFSSWTLLALLYDGHLQQHQFMNLATGLKSALADSLEVCRSAVRVIDMNAVNVDFIVDPLPPPKQDRRPDHPASLVHRIRQLIRSDSPSRREHPLQHVNMTQVKASYEVRIFREIRVSEAEVARRIDRLQMYSRFSELNRLLTRALATSDPIFSDSVMLDDIGYASRHLVSRPALTKGQVGDCIEEGELSDARQRHQYAVAASLLLVVLITCAGSAVFTIKSPSLVPSRMNPLGSQQQPPLQQQQQQIG